MSSTISQARRQLRARLADASVALMIGCALCGCAPGLNLGERTCSKDGSETVIPPVDAPVSVPWGTGFENRFCDYTELNGYCYTAPGATLASWELVTEPPPHGGRYAAAFTIRAVENDPANQQTRCVRQGALPTDAYYGAWYFIPFAPTKINNWNLFHFDGGSGMGPSDGKLDLSLIEVNGHLQLAVFGLTFNRVGGTAKAPNVPIGEWFRVQLYLKRAGAAGQVRLYQDGQLIFDEKVATDDSPFGAWYVGNLAYGLTPPDSTVYVDDITLRDDPL